MKLVCTQDWTAEHERRCSVVIHKTALSPAARLLYLAMANWPPLTVGNLAVLLGMSQRGVQSLLKELAANDLLVRTFLFLSEDAVKLLRAKEAGRGLDIGGVVCSWCGVQTAALEQHHHPIRRSDGGQAVVHICANCHGEYHFLTAPLYRIGGCL